MYNTNIEEMTTAILSSFDKEACCNVLPLNAKEIIQKALEQYWSDKVAIIWSIDDVFSKADEMEIKLTDEEAEDILNELLDDHDCSRGITWDNIEETIRFRQYSKETKE